MSIHPSCSLTVSVAIATHSISAGGAKLPKLPPRLWCWRPPSLGLGGKWGRTRPSLPTPAHALASHLRSFCVVFNTANVYHLPNRLDRFCFLLSGGGGEAPPVAKEPPPRTVTG